MVLPVIWVIVGHLVGSIEPYKAIDSGASGDVLVPWAK